MKPKAEHTITGHRMLLTALLCIMALTSPYAQTPGADTGQGTLLIRFTNTANGKPVALNDSMYSNFFGEQYSIRKLKYYISHIALTTGNGKTKSWDDCHLVDENAGETSFEITADAGRYEKIGFLLGVDSAKNCSGAQDGALDPMNGMFWTWNSGYIMFKLEGYSTASTADLQRIEHHIGGYKGADNVATFINLQIKQPQTLFINPGETTELVLEMNLDKYWHSNTDIRIAELPMCMVTGEPALKVARNFSGLFSVKEIRKAN